MNILIGISWPFANGDLHIGHAASSLPGDVIARYHRLKGNNVVLVSGSDCHGTPIDVKVLQEKKTAKEIVDILHTGADTYLEKPLSMEICVAQAKSTDEAVS